MMEFYLASQNSSLINFDIILAHDELYVSGRDIHHCP